MIEYKVRVYEDRTEWRNQKDELHREDGPAVEYRNGDKYWMVDGNLHRLDGPAIEYESGDREWWLNGELHRLDGPASQWMDGAKAWYIEGKLHRLDGPAFEWPNGDRDYWIDGAEYSEEDFNKKIQEMNSSCDGKVVEIDESLRL